MTASVDHIFKNEPGEGLTEDEVHQAAASKLRSNRRYQDDELRSNWEAAYKYYKGEAPGESPATDSTMVSTDVSDVIEWVLPAVLKPLIESPDVVRFDPVDPEDVEQAATESDYVHHTLMKECNGFLKLYNHVKDALILKNGVFCTYWDDETRHQKESYTDLGEAELADLLAPSDGSRVKLISSRSRELPMVDVQTGVPLPQQPGMPPPTYTVYDVDVRRVRERGRAKVENCVPEEFQIDFAHNSIDLSEARWCCYSMRKSRAELVALGYDESKIDEMTPESRARWDDEVRWAREDVEHSADQYDDNDTPDRSQDMFEINRVYMMLDVDGDGLEEHWLIILGGRDGQQMLDSYEVPENPFSASTPFISAHKFYGQSFFDKIRKLADHKSKVLRMLEDNLDLANNPYKKVVRGAVDMDTALTRQVGGLYIVDEVNALTEVPAPVIGQQAQQLLDYLDKMRSERSGTDPNAQSISKVLPEESMNSAVERVLSMKEELVGLIIRVFAETGIRDMLLKLRGVLARNRIGDQTVQLRNKWATVNPGNWVERMDTTIKVGLGTGDQIQKTNGLNTILGIQMQAMQGGLQGVLVSPERIAYTISELVRTQRLGDPEDFILSPELLADPRNTDTPRGQEMVRAQQFAQQQARQQQQEAQAQQQAQAQAQQQLLDMQREIEQIRSQAKISAEQIKAQTANQDRMAEMAMDVKKLTLEWAKLRAEETEGEDKLTLDRAKVMIDAGLKSQQTTGNKEGGN